MDDEVGPLQTVAIQSCCAAALPEADTQPFRSKISAKLARHRRRPP